MEDDYEREEFPKENQSFYEDKEDIDESDNTKISTPELTDKSNIPENQNQKGFLPSPSPSLRFDKSPELSEIDRELEELLKK